MAQGSPYSSTDMRNKASDNMGRVADKVEDAAGRMAEQGREVGHQVQEAAENVRRVVDRSIKDQPITTLAIAAGIGFVLGALWKN